MYKGFIDYFGLQDDIATKGKSVEDFVSTFSKQQLDEGLFNIFDINDIDLWTMQMHDIYPNIKKSYRIFGFDWLGRCFGIISKKLGKDEILIFDPRDLEVYSIQCNFLDFINEEIPQNPEKYLLLNSFEQWKKLTNKQIPEMHCVGYNVPLFLGGQGTLENLEVTDMDVYWSITAQLKEAISDLDEGTVVEGFTIE